MCRHGRAAPATNSPLSSLRHHPRPQPNSRTAASMFNFIRPRGRSTLASRSLLPSHELHLPASLDLDPPSHHCSGFAHESGCGLRASLPNTLVSFTPNSPTAPN
ncbi:unnamed protein product [Cuscuta europaea]|uniref:Uncharacterized protein n=1 Tax=Cuscuta europaea TaxID=41803 RepID=A0A9P1E6Z9_CUSEU|nr:unnamed protein product [Cuscuta europaea]